MRLFLCIAFCVFGTISNSQNQNLISVDQIIEIIEASGSSQVEHQVLTINDDTIEGFIAGYSTNNEEAVDRMIQALQTSYYGGKVITVAFENPLLSFSAVEFDGKAVFVRFWIPTSIYARAEDLSLAVATTQEAIEALLGAPMEGNLEDTIGPIWNSRGFVQFSEPLHLNRLHAWGVPPDFIEFVVTGRPDCPFLPVKGWLARFICE